MEQENNKNEGLVQSNTSEKRSPELSKVKSDIAKSVAKNFLKTRKAINTSESEVQKRKRQEKNKSISESSKVSENDDKKQNSREDNPQKDATTSMVHVKKSQQIQQKEENTYQSAGKKKSRRSNRSTKIRGRGRLTGFFNKNQKHEEKHRGKRNRKWNEQIEKHRSSEKNSKNKEKSGGKGKKQENKMKEKIEGLIFMCNAKTKPDCFRYRVMGVPNDKKDLVLGIRRGFKLFLYDYDLKLMYGVYKASSSGGMKLEPEAFGGAFPAQVRFSVHADCFPLAESIFKKAIKENYNKNNRFKTELTARQVRKLTKLFRPVTFHSTALPVHSHPSRVAARILEHPEIREAHDRPRESRHASDREASARDPYANISPRSYPVLSHERDREIVYGELPPIRREDIHRDLYLNENDYGAYGFRGERRYTSLQRHLSPRLGSYHRDYKEQPLCQPDVVYSESVPMPREIIISDPLYSNEKEYRTYNLGGTKEMQSTVFAGTTNSSVAGASTLDSYATDPHYSRYYGASLFDSYLPHSNRMAHRIETGHLRRENNQVDGYASAIPAYWYSFTGGSFLYR